MVGEVTWGCVGNEDDGAMGGGTAEAGGKNAGMVLICGAFVGGGGG